MKIKKRLLSWLLCGAMLLSLCPRSVLAEGGTQDSGETAAPSNAQNSLTQLITAWEWVDEWKALPYDGGAAAWVLALPGASESNLAMREDIVSLLPESITATLDGEPETISLDGWTCEDYPEAGAGSGSYTFIAALPEGYELDVDASALAVTVELGGAELFVNASTYDISTGSITIDDSCGSNCGGHTITGTTTSNTITVSGGSHTIILSGVSISGGCPLNLNNAGETTITLVEGTTNTLKADAGQPGICVPNGNKVTFNGTGALNVTGGYNFAGIGRSGNSNILIESGNITAQGGNRGAGIGGNNGQSGGTVVITGGHVIAIGASTGGAGIGGGNFNSADSVMISGANTVVEANGVDGYSYGIGMGYKGDTSKDSVTISDGATVIINKGRGDTTNFVPANRDPVLYNIALK